MTTPDPALNGAAHAPKPATRSAVERMLLEGQGTPAIAKALAISRRSVRGHAVAIRKRRADGRHFGIWYRKVASKMIVCLICVAASGSAGCAG